MENGIAKPMLRSLLLSYVLSGIFWLPLLALYKLRLKESQVNLLVFAIYFITWSGRRLSCRETHPAAALFLGTPVRAVLLPGAFCRILGHESWKSH